jgi:hypothetical protein
MDCLGDIVLYLVLRPVETTDKLHRTSEDASNAQTFAETEIIDKQHDYE